MSVLAKVGSVIGATVGSLALAYLMVFGLPRVAPWGYRVVFWTPAALSTGLLVLGALLLSGDSGAGTGTAGYGGAALVTVAPALMLNLSLFAAPSAIMRAGPRFPVVTTILLTAGLIYYGTVTVLLARPNHPDADLRSIVAAFFLLYLLGLVHIVRAFIRYRTHYRTAERAEAPFSENSG
jgi:hypothetical protein